MNITNKSQEVSPFPAGGHKAAMNRRESMINTRHKSTNGPQKKYRLEGLNRFHSVNLTLDAGIKRWTHSKASAIQNHSYLWTFEWNMRLLKGVQVISTSELVS